MILRDYTCTVCDETHELLVAKDEVPACPTCKSTALNSHPGGNLFNKIIPTYPGSAKLKAGYAHKHVNRPAEKISVTVPGKAKT